MMETVLTTDKSKYGENLKFVLEQMPSVCSGYMDKVKKFGKDTYAGAFESFQKEKFAFFNALKSVSDCVDGEEAESVFQQIADALVKEQKKEIEAVIKKNEKATVQMNKNMFMAVYFLPAVKELHSKNADLLADRICREWGKNFKNSNIKASDYQSIVSGFKKKLCYITTAVCQNLQKGEDCEELQLIRDFRDGYLSSTEDGREWIVEYYDIAPTLVKRIAKDAEAQAKYIWLWNYYIAPCVVFIKDGKYEDCKERYCEMVERLKREYIK